ncbi:unnamed protein product [Linum trigynum]|uniref:Uncharacterized protein n=1 Tax=Linum trigynum TaxID=586398 RepID=A0AAV2FUE1_9ROSI
MVRTTPWTRLKGHVDIDPVVRRTEAESTFESTAATQFEDQAMAEKTIINSELLQSIVATFQTQFDQIQRQLAELRTTVYAPVPSRPFTEHGGNHQTQLEEQTGEANKELLARVQELE